MATAPVRDEKYYKALYRSRRQHDIAQIRKRGWQHTIGFGIMLGVFVIFMGGGNLAQAFYGPLHVRGSYVILCLVFGIIIWGVWYTLWLWRAEYGLRFHRHNVEEAHALFNLRQPEGRRIAAPSDEAYEYEPFSNKIVYGIPLLMLVLVMIVLPVAYLY
jgi:hypothetical protein